MIKISIIPFDQKYANYFYDLNVAWLQKYFYVEPYDKKVLGDPQTYIIDKGGFIYYAKLNNEIVGTVSLLKKTDTIFELGKMAVTKKAQGFKIGTILLEYALNVAKEKQIKKLILYSNTILKSAIHLYQKYGFVEIELESGLYERANIKMEKEL